MTRGNAQSPRAGGRKAVFERAAACHSRQAWRESTLCARPWPVATTDESRAVTAMADA
jgi:hypothetical protein